MKQLTIYFILFLVGCGISFSQSNNSIYYTSEENSRGRDIYRMNTDGKDKVKLTKKLGNGHYPHHNIPKISPDGKQIVFQSDPDGHDRYTIWKMNIDGSNVQKLTQKEGLFPNWSPDGKQVIFSGRRKGTWEILIIPGNGGDEVSVTKNKEKGIHPGWGAVCSFHPDGKSIIFNYVREKKLTHLNLETKEQKYLGIENYSYTYPVFSSDGNSIIVNRKKDKSYDLVQLNANGSNEKILATNVISYSAPAWSDNEIIFCGMVKGNQELFKLYLDSGKETQLTNNNDFDAMPTW